MLKRPTRQLLIAAAVVAALAAFAPSANAACADADLPFSASDAGSVSAAVVCLVNNERAARGLPVLARDGQLDAAALGHAIDMADQDYFSHQSKDGRSPSDRIAAAGYAAAVFGENIAAGNTTASATVAQWMASDGHCRNILRSDFTDIGVGVAAGGTYGTYWTENFGSRSAATGPVSTAADGCPFKGLISGPVTPPSGSGCVAGPDVRVKLRSLRRARHGRVRISGKISGTSCCPKTTLQLKRGSKSRSYVRNLCGSFVVRLRPPKGDRRVRVKVKLSNGRSASKSIRL